MRRLADLELEASESAAARRQRMAVWTSNLSLTTMPSVCFHALLEKYPDYERNDSVLYQLARAYEIAGKTDDALRVLNELVEKISGDTD